MASTSSSSLSSLNRMSGLVSGLDTEALVKSMATNTKNRLNGKKQKLQTLQWKQETYRKQLSAITSFQNKYLSMTSSTSIKANVNMSKFAASSSNSKVTATASASATAATYTIKEASSASKASYTGKNVIDNAIDLDLSSVESGQEVTLKFTLDGTSKEIKFTGGSSLGDTKQNLIDSLNTSYKTGNFSFDTDDDGDSTDFLKFTPNNTSDGIHHTFSVKYNTAIGLKNDSYSDINGTATLGSINFTNGLGYSGYNFTEQKTTTQNDEGITEEHTTHVGKGYYAMEINGTKFEFDDDTTVTSLMNKINDANIGVKVSFSAFNQSFSIESTSTGADKSISIKEVKGLGLPEDSSAEAMANRPTMEGGNLAQALFGQSEVSAYGSDSTITVSQDGVNFVKYTSASNAFTFDGTTINLTNLGELKDTDEAITINTKRDYSAVKDLVVNFVNDYNSLIEGIRKEITTTRPKSNGSFYDPLTEEQEEEMDASQIEKWNDQAKIGLLYQDSNLTSFLNQINSTMMKGVNGFSLSDLGVTSPRLTDNGKLTIDESKLESCLENYGDAASKFFTDLTDGLGARLSTTFDNAVSTKKGHIGYLTQYAGIEGTSTDKVNTLYTEMYSLQKLVDSMQEKYENEMERYWKRFSTLETYINNMNSQSSVFSPQA